MSEQENVSCRRVIIVAVLVTAIVLLGVVGGAAWVMADGGSGNSVLPSGEAQFTSVEPPNAVAAELGQLGLMWAQVFGYESARVTGYYDAGPDAEPYGCGRSSHG